MAEPVTLDMPVQRALNKLRGIKDQMPVHAAVPGPAETPYSFVE